MDDDGILVPGELHDIVLDGALDSLYDSVVLVGLLIVTGPQVIVQSLPVGFSMVLGGLVELLLHSLLVLTREAVLMVHCKYLRT